MKMTAQELIEMTPEQQRAFNRFEKAANDFKKAGGRFYTVLEKIHGLNGKYVVSILTDVQSGGHIDTQLDVSIDFIFDWGFSGFADDTHMIKLTDEGLALLSEEG
ncbi:hypothetical protein [Providencia rettgeri]|uniref:hypothetical protein n=1 Tax=Providencia rettgeri TaxID=587 RepID=UPI002940FB30|nr:hypothetical protein [Providencia rettgeri]ELR5224433.1 hypothetical protein [Providencia rettgeri]MDX7322332.1 hypothetical protein [Providencia rettgeri]